MRRRLASSAGRFRATVEPRASSDESRMRFAQLPTAHRAIAGSGAWRTPHFLLLFAAMLVAAAGNTALQSVMPAIGREIGIADFWVAIAYTWSAVLWVVLAPFWAAKSDHHGRKRLTLMGVGGFIVSMTLCGFVLAGRARRAGRRGGDLRPVRHLPRDLRLARLRHAERDPGLSRLAAPGASARVDALVGLGLVVRPRDDHRPGHRAVVRAAVRRPARTVVRLRADRHRRVRGDRRSGCPTIPSGRRVGHGAAMSYPSLASPPTGASVIAATSPTRTPGSSGTTRASARGSWPGSSPAMPRRRP